MKLRYFGIGLLVILFLALPGFAAETPTQQLNSILIKIKDLQEKQKGLEELSGFGGEIRSKRARWQRK